MCFRGLVEISLMDMINKGTLDSILMKNFECLSHSDAFMDGLEKMVQRHPALIPDPAALMGRITERKIGDGVEKKDEKHIYSRLSETKSSSNTFDVK